MLSDGRFTCPKCGSDQITGQKKGYDVGGGGCGAALLGPLGLLSGALDANKATVTCLRCGPAWNPGGGGAVEKLHHPEC